MNRIPLAAAGVAALLTLAACGSSSSGGGGGSGSTPPAASQPAASQPAASQPAASQPAVSQPAVSQPAGNSSPPVAAPKITIKDFGYSGTLSVKAGETVTVLNEDSVAHTLTDKQTQKFDTGTIAPGGTGTFTAPTKPGSYPFGCTLHPEMAGTLVVTG